MNSLTSLIEPCDISLNTEQSFTMSITDGSENKAQILLDISKEASLSNVLKNLVLPRHTM